MTKEKTPLKVGIIIPIAPIDGCSAEHWSDVKRIIVESVSSISGYECETKIVSEGDSIGLIHKRIVEGLYKSDIIICDVSCKNPNVMFELGMRLAFDKPTVIIKDDKTDYSFDTGGIEHIEYPRDLRFTRIVDFKILLSKKVESTYLDSVKDPEHSPFLKSFGPFKATSINEAIISTDQFIIESLQELQNDISSIKNHFFLQRKSSIGATVASKIDIIEILETHKKNDGIVVYKDGRLNLVETIANINAELIVSNKYAQDQFILDTIMEFCLQNGLIYKR